MRRMLTKSPRPASLTLKALDIRLRELEVQVGVLSDIAHEQERIRQAGQKALEAYALRYPHSFWGRLRWLLTGR